MLSSSSNELYEFHEVQELQESQEIQESQETQETQVRVHKKHTETQETQDCDQVACVFTLLDAVKISISKKVSKDSLFIYAQAILALKIRNSSEVEGASIESIFGFWWNHATSKLPQSADFNIYLSKFKYLYPKVKQPLHIPPMDAAIAYADANIPDPELGKRVGRLALVCKRLQEITGDKPFFISVRQVSKIIETKDTYESLGVLQHLSDLGYIRLARENDGRKANEYRYIKSI